MATSEFDWEHWSRAPFDMTFLSGGQSGKLNPKMGYQLYLGENSEPQMIPTSNLGQPGLTQGPTQAPFDDNLVPKKI